MPSLIHLNQISVAYPDGERKAEVLRGLSLEISHSEVVAVTGVSGSGKSTLLSVIGTLLCPDSGEYLFNGTEVSILDDTARAQFRNRSIGFVFQDHRLLPQFTVRENILLPALAQQPQTTKEQDERADYLMQTTGSHSDPEALMSTED